MIDTQIKRYEDFKIKMNSFYKEKNKLNSEEYLLDSLLTDKILRSLHKEKELLIKKINHEKEI